MKSSTIHFLIVVSALFILTGCYTSFKAIPEVEPERGNGIGQTTYDEDGLFEESGPYYYVDYGAREWYGYQGIDLAGDTTTVRMAYSSHNPTRSYWFSPYSESFFYNYPGYSNSKLYSPYGPFALGNANIIPGVFHPPYFSNQYMYSFFYDRWAQWYYWDSERPNSWCYNPFQLSAFYGSSLPCEETSSIYSANLNHNSHISERVRVSEVDDLKLRERDRVLAGRFDQNGVREIRSRTEILRTRIDNVKAERVQTGINRQERFIRWAIEVHERNRSRNTSSNYNRNSSRYSGTSHNSGVRRTGSSVHSSSGSSSGRTRSGSSTTRENNN